VALARAAAALAERRGVTVRTGAHVREIAVSEGRATGVVLSDGQRIRADAVLHAGDPRALASGLLGPAVRGAVPPPARPSLSARVWAFAARAGGLPLAHHTVLFSGDDAAEFAALAAGRAPDSPTLYLCAQDRGGDRAASGLERFEIIMNAPPTGGAPDPGEDARCHETMLRTLRARGLRLDPEPGPEAMTSPAGFADLFPGSLGALYGEASLGLTGALRRPRARSRVPGLYLAGGGTHPGAGVPMAALSGRHAAEAITRDLASTRPSRRRDTDGGISTPWRTGAPDRGGAG
jgi:1-hydroxycarotenoid 3,4-desaturase